MSTSHPDIPVEQAYIDHAVDCLKAAERTAQRMVEQEHAGGNRHAVRKIHEMGESLLRRRLAAEDRICFARIDDVDGQSLYIGREVIHSKEPGKARKPVVISWRVPAAAPYYEAHPDDPLGLVRKRRFDLDGTTLVALDDEVLQAAAGADYPATLDGKPPPPPRGQRDALLRELERARSPEMQDIVPTIEREQFALIRASRDRTLVVQGGPGTGKTAVALHRAAWLAFNHARELQPRGGILVIGPNQAFMQYIGGVLPGLGEHSVTQAAINRLVVAQDPAGRTVQSSREDTRELAFLKGDSRMAGVVTNCVEQRVRAPERSVDVSFGRVEVSLPVQTVTRLIRSSWGDGDRSHPYMEARTRFRTSMRAVAEQEYRSALGDRSASLDQGQLERALHAASGPWFNALERIWPTMSAPQLVHELYTIDRRMSAAAEGLLEPHEQAALMRRNVNNVREQPWTIADLPIVDEADAALNGGRSRASYGYVIVDEAQDMTPMQLRMAGRRAGTGGLTLVGDLAQATGPWTYANWDQIVEQIPGARATRRGDLLIGYRVPEPITSFASSLLPRIAPGLEPVRAVRPGRPPVVEQVESDDLPLLVAVEADALREGDRTVGVIVPPSLLQSTRAALADGGVQIGDIERDALERQVTLLPASAAKGLEFDHVVVAEPAAIVREGLHGFGELYVALTRATQRLAVVHSEALPAPLSAPGTGPSASVPPRVVESRRLDSKPEVPVMELGGSFSEALVYAKMMHGRQARRGTAVPYMSHLLAVSALVLEDGGTEEEAIAALLHDVAEDHGGADAIRDIARRFGDTVAGIVALCTDPVDVEAEWRVVKEAHLDTLMKATASVRRVALAEKLDNARTIVRKLREVGVEMWPTIGVDSSDLLWYFGELVELFAQVHPGAMAAELADQVEDMTALGGPASPRDG